MLRVKNGKYYMVSSSRRSLFVGFLYKATKLRDHLPMRISYLTRTLTFKNEGAATRCYAEMHDARGVTLVLRGNKLRVKTHRIVEFID